MPPIEPGKEDKTCPSCGSYFRFRSAKSKHCEDSWHNDGSVPVPSPDSLRRLEEIEARLNAATPGPWEVEKSDSSRTGSVHYSVKTTYKPREHDWSPRFITFMCGGLGEFHPSRPMNEYRCDPKIEADVNLIASAPSDIRYLLDQLKERR